MARTGMNVATAAFATGERGVDQHDVRRVCGIEQVVNELGVVPCDRQVQSKRQEVGSKRITFVEDQPGAGALSMDGQHAGTSGGFRTVSAEVSRAA